MCIVWLEQTHNEVIFSDNHLHSKMSGWYIHDSNVLLHIAASAPIVIYITNILTFHFTYILQVFILISFFTLQTFCDPQYVHCHLMCLYKYGSIWPDDDFVSQK
jgi:predicted CDP-diglyceride synthetase/phosphatidate cytidylyltransferase